ncbi:hypothetical protein B0H15DRAFT_957201 [Mycena belliarum]|uniref:Glycosyltransferase n=1 Tax=Mycena belliarum TaxID=1033014 RepID=A0AAD6XGY6_9AGAR|nr:hypothetical protein B0H15DRAFT_957201 [Mycena belliae]
MVPHHIVALLHPAWGHTVSYIYIATQMLQKDPALVLTIVHHNVSILRMHAELKMCDYDLARLRLAGIGEKGATFADTMNQLVDGWKELLKPLAEGDEQWPRPHSIHMDFFYGGYVVEHTKQVLGPECKILSWFSSAAASMQAILSEYDFAAIALEIYSDKERRLGRTEDEILDQVVLAWNGSDRFSGSVIKCPGVPDMYDYERVGQASGPRAPGVSQLFVQAQNFAKYLDGYIVPTSTCLEPVGVPLCREYYQKRGEELFIVGPQAVCWVDTAPVSPANPLVRSFLEGSLSQFGAKSILYISFGQASIYLEPFPFIFALGGRMASLPEDVIQLVNSSGRGLICDFWVEQRAILQHEAVGWFLTHGGYNSITESLAQGIPLIVWPLDAEQPVNAALFSAGPNPVAIELVQVRTGAQVAPSLREGPAITGTVADASAELKAAFDAARGARGVGLRQNATKMAEALREARSGEADEALTRLARF